jgi:hypothetical protein
MVGSQENGELGTKQGYLHGQVGGILLHKGHQLV